MKKSRMSLTWRIAIVFLGTVCIWWIVSGVNSWINPGEGYDQLAHIVSALISSLISVPMIIIARKYLDQRPWSGLQLSSFKKGWKPFIIGGLAYLIPAVSSMLIFVLFGWTEISLEGTYGEFFQQLVLLVGLVFLFEALPEELIFRGYMYRNLNTVFNRSKAILYQSILFTLFGIAIGAGLSIDRILIFFFMSIVIGTIRVNTGDVWSAVGFHLVFQTIQQIFGSHVLTTSNPVVTEMIIFGVIPFSFALTVVKLFEKNEPDLTVIDSE